MHLWLVHKYISIYEFTMCYTYVSVHLNNVTSTKYICNIILFTPEQVYLIGMAGKLRF